MFSFIHACINYPSLSQMSVRMPGVPEFNQVRVHKYVSMIFLMT